MIAIDVYGNMPVREFTVKTGVTLDPSESKTMDRCLKLSSTVFVGKIHGDVVCSWGLIPPTVLSEQAYLWMYTTPQLEEHKFLFVRHSQRVIEDMLGEYERIVGHVVMGNDLAFRWLRWLGAKFGAPENKLIPFRIDRHD